MTFHTKKLNLIYIDNRQYKVTGVITREEKNDNS